MFPLYTYLDEHAQELFQAELLFAFFVIAVGCGIALHGASNSRKLQAALLGETKMPPSDSLLGLGNLPLNAMDLGDKYGNLCNLRIFSKVGKH